MSILECSHIRFAHSTGAPVLFDNFSLTFEEGSFSALCGPNGAGKSSLLRLLAGLRSPSAGTVFLDGGDMAVLTEKQRARLLAYVPQSVHFAFPVTALECVAMGRFAHAGFLGRLGPEDLRQCARALHLCDATPLSSRWVGELSGGERQRVLLASALAQDPRVLLLDEPTLSLDLAHQESFLSVVRRLHTEEHRTVLMATHDLNLAARYSSRLVLLEGGRVVSDGDPSSVLVPQRVSSVFGTEVRRIQDPDGSFHLVPAPPAGKSK
jgi:iron complex transport system ATP-binding protein